MENVGPIRTRLTPSSVDYGHAPRITEELLFILDDGISLLIAQSGPVPRFTLSFLSL